ncbi:retrovirus-related pol polyprotein from transposon TNT 1-94 [Tanacetum coccineum]
MQRTRLVMVAHGYRHACERKWIYEEFYWIQWVADAIRIFLAYLLHMNISSTKWMLNTTVLEWPFCRKEFKSGQLTGLGIKDNLNHVYKLKKALYGLKQAPHAWYDLLSKFLLSQKFFKGTLDPTLFLRRQGKDISPNNNPDLTFSVCMCARYQAKPTEKYLHAIKRIFKYLRGTVNKGLWHLKDSSIALTAYANVDHAGCQDTRQSTSGDMDQDSAHVVAVSKVPMLKPGEFELWRMRIEQYIQMIDYVLWEFIENGNTATKITVVEGVEKVMPPTAAEEKA